MSLPDRCSVVCLWATNDRYGPHFVAAVSASLDDVNPEEVAHLRAIAEEWFENWGDDHGWRFWTTRDDIERPVAAPELEPADGC